MNLYKLTSYNQAANGELTKDAINKLPLWYYPGLVTVVCSEEAAKIAKGTILAQSVVGFDTETKPSFRKGVIHNPSLIQIATSDEVFLFPLKVLGLTESIKQILESANTVKVGVAINDDFKALSRLTTFTPQGMLDLSQVAKKNSIPHLGLRGLAAYFLGIRISKGEQCSNWGKMELSNKQILYAATDAWVSLAIYLRMKDTNLLE